MPEYLRPYVYFMIVSFLVSLLVYIRPKPEHRYLFIFPPFLLATIATEWWGLYLGSLVKPNLHIYNFFTVVEFCFYLVFISLVIHTKTAKTILLVSSGLYAIGASINIILNHNERSFHITGYAVGCLIVVLACIYYFFELLRYPKSVKLINTPAFWICSGLLFFYICGFAVYGFINELIKVKLIFKNFSNIINLLNIFLYSLFTIAFLCTKTRKYTLSPS